MAIYLDTPPGVVLADGWFMDLYQGNPRTGTQPIQSITFTAGAPNLSFTNLDDAQNYTLVHRSALTYELVFVLQTLPGTPSTSTHLGFSAGFSIGFN